MAKKQIKADDTWQRIRTGVMTAALLKPVIDQLMSKGKSSKHSSKFSVSKLDINKPWVELRARIEDQISETQTQIEKLAKNVTGSAQSLTNQAQAAAAQTLHKADKRIWWASGLAVGFGVAGLVTFLVVRRRMHGQIEDETLIPLPDVNTNGHYSSEDHLKNAVAQVKQRQGMVGGTTGSSTATATEASTAAFIGNAHSRVYHPATSEHLPAVEHRVYFRTEAEAKAAGYRAIEGE